MLILKQYLLFTNEMTLEIFINPGICESYSSEEVKTRITVQFD